jgi:hypothetical protein
VQVAQLFHALLLGKNNEIVEATLPNVSHGGGCGPKRIYLDISFSTKFPQQPMGEGLLQRGQHQRRISALRFGGEKMDMLRHDHVTDDYKLMTLADLLHNFEEEIAKAGCPEKGTALITTCGNKVGVSSPVVAMQVCRHGNGITGTRRFSCDR